MTFCSAYGKIMRIWIREAQGISGGQANEEEI